MFWGRVVFIVICISYKLTVFLYQRNKESRFALLRSHQSFESGHRTIWHCVFDRQSILRLSTWYLIVISTITIHYYTIWVLCYLTTIIPFSDMIYMFRSTSKQCRGLFIHKPISDSLNEINMYPPMSPPSLGKAHKKHFHWYLGHSFQCL